jgi:hypothetical protein
VARKSRASVRRTRPPRRVKTWKLNAIIGVFLLPIAVLLTQTFFTAFSRATTQHGFWRTEEFWFFSLGAVIWLLWFFASMGIWGEPRPLRVYVFGHELTHAIWVWLMGGKVDVWRSRVSRDGGHVIVTKNNFWIALAPYFYPLFSLVVMLLYGGTSLFYNVAAETRHFLGMTPLQWMFLAIGATWAFHMSFTCWMIPKGQTDLTAHGTFFSLVIIYIMNLLILALFLIIAAPEIGFASFGLELLENTEDFSQVAWDFLARVFSRMMR